MSPPRCLSALGTILLFSSCGDDVRPRAEKTLREVGPPKLRREAASLYKELFVAPTGQYFVPKVDQWPPTFRRFQPLHVRAYVDGFSLSLRDARGTEEGIYVVPTGMENIPGGSRTARFLKIEEGIYWYHFTD